MSCTCDTDPTAADAVPCTLHPPNPRAEVCRKCGNWMFVLNRRCEWDGKTCEPRKGANRG